MTGAAGLTGGIGMAVVYVLSSGYFFPEMRHKSRALYFAGGLVALLGGAILIGDMGRHFGLSPLLTSAGTPPAVADPGAGDDLALSLPAPTGGSSEPDSSGGPLIPVYRVLALSDGGWPPLWSELSRDARIVANLPPGSQVELLGNCAYDTTGWAWCPVGYGLLSGWISGPSLQAN
ncbi:MAG: hypothetical protein R3D33_07290 [Hyphomicrobiaceae bacterium]